MPDFTFFATAEMVSLLGATPVFADVLPDTLQHRSPAGGGEDHRRTRGVIAVSLYGQCADFDELVEIARRRKLFLVEDAAQSFGATYKGRKSGALCELATTSFYPAKPLGAYGDAGALFTSDDELAGRLRMLANHGQPVTYRHRLVGINGRLDTLQAAILKVKLRHFPEELERRQQVADWYEAELSWAGFHPAGRKGNTSPAGRSTRCAARSGRICIEQLKQRGIPTAIHYPMPLHQQEVYSDLGLRDGDFPVSVKASQEVFSLPMHPFLTARGGQTGGRGRSGRRCDEPAAVGRDRRGPHGVQPRARALGDGETSAWPPCAMRIAKRWRRSPAATWSRRPYTDIDQLLGKEKLDGVVIAIPTSEHLQAAELCLERGAARADREAAGLLQSQQCDEILGRPPRRGCRCCRATSSASTRWSIQLKQFLDENFLGKIFYIETVRSGPFPKRLYGSKDGVVIDLAVHDLDLVNYLFGRLEQLYAHHIQTDSHRQDIYARVMLKTVSGVLGSSEFSWISPRKERSISIYGDKGMLVGNLIDQEVWFYENGDVDIDYSDNYYQNVIWGRVSEGKVIKFPTKKEEPLRKELEFFCRLVRGEVSGLRSAVRQAGGGVLAGGPGFGPQRPDRPVRQERK